MNIRFNPVSGFVFGLGGIAPTGDPLAGIAYRLRFETTWDGVTLRPMWQDVARTTLVTAEGDPVATMGPDGAEFLPEQSSGASQGVMFLETDGTPYIELDGVDDFYEVGVMGGQVTFTCLFKSIPATWNTFWSLLDQTAGSPGDRFGLFAPGGTQWHNDPFPTSVSKDGVALVSPFNMTPIDDWMVATVVSNNSPNDINRALFQLESNFFGQAGAIAFFVYDGTPSAGDITTVEAFYTTLIPS